MWISDRFLRCWIPTNTGGERVRNALLGLFMAVAVALALAPLADAGQTQTVACCGGTPGFP